MVALGFGTYLGMVEIREASRNQASPQIVSLASLITLHTPPQELVSIHGLLFSDARIEYGRKQSDGTLKSIKKAWAPLVDQDTSKALFVRIDPRRPQQSEPEEVTLTGMLRPIDEQLKPELTRLGFNYGGVPVDPVYMLVEGDRPGNLALAVSLTAAAAITLLLFVVASVNRNVIFREGGYVSVSMADADQNIPIAAACS
jgi:hypothetical protein